MQNLSKEIPLEQLISRQIRVWEKGYANGVGAERQKIMPCITISRSSGGGGSELAQGLTGELGWEVFGKEVVEYIAENANVRTKIVELFDEKKRSELESWVLTLIDHHALGTRRYFKSLVSVIMSIGEHGRAIILGRGGNFILSASKALRIKVVAPMELRIDRVAKKYKTSRSEAKKIIEEADKERAAFAQRYFHKNIDDPLHYDLVLNTGTLDIEVAKKIVIKGLTEKFTLLE